MQLRQSIIVALCVLALPLTGLGQGRTPGENAASTEPAANAAEIQELFDSLFVDRLKQVAATRDSADDLALAAEMIELAGNSTSTPGVLVLLCENALMLASKSPKGFETADAALALLLEHAPHRKADWLDKSAEIRQGRYATARSRDDKSKAGEALIEALLMLGDLHLENSKTNQAVSAYRRAMTVAGLIRSQQLPAVKAKYDAAAGHQRIVRKAEQLDARFAANPKDATLAKQLVQIYLVDLDDPVGAAKYALALEDPTLIENIARMTGQADSPSEDDSKALGRWYKKLATEATTDQAKAAMLTRARFYHQEFLARHGADDLEGKAFEIALKGIESNLAKLEEAEAKAAAKSGSKTRSGRMIDVLSLVDPAKHTLSGTWQRNGRQLGLTAPTPFAKIRFPVIPRGSYELSMEFTRVKGQWSMGPILPVADKSVALQMSYNTGGKFYSGLHEVDGRGAPKNATTRDGALIDGKRYQLTVRVLLTNAQNAKVLVYLDGKPYLAWQGATSSLSQSARFAISDPVSLGFVAYNTQMVFHSVKLKMLSGKAVGLSGLK